MMSDAPKSVVDDKVDNTKRLGLAGGLLFFLGLAAAFMAWFTGDLESKVKMAVSAAVLLSMGYPALLYVRMLRKVAALEKRIDDLQKRVGPSGS